jgi:hypothetical protein
MFPGVTSSLPQEVREVFANFVTTEFATVDAHGQPITWPVTPYYTQGGPTIDITTGIGYPKKANDARSHPRVALLFSDPTGSGMDSAPIVLVQGMAEVDDADLAENRRRYRRESLAKLPATRDMLPPKLLEGLFGWYFDRIYVKVRPERVFMWEGGDLSMEPDVHDAHLEEVRSGHIEEPAEEAVPEPAAGRDTPGREAEGVARSVWDERMDELGARHKTAVLSWAASDGFPLATRLPIRLDRDAGHVVLTGSPNGLPLAPGRACLTAHAHAPDFSWQENFQVRGDLIRSGDGWALVPRQLVGGFELPDESEFARYRRNFRKSVRFYRISREYKKAR